MKWVIALIAIVVILGGGICWLVSSQNAKAAKLDAFAICVAESGAKFYGAFWCPHCQSQKAMFHTFFSDASKKLPYIECSTPDGNHQLEVCNKENIESYPTWKFSNGVVRTGEIPLQEIANQTNCSLP